MALLWKLICNLEDPMSLRHPVRTKDIFTFIHRYFMVNMSEYCTVIQCAVLRHNVMQYVAVCCSVLQCVAVSFGVDVLSTFICIRRSRTNLSPLELHMFVCTFVSCSVLQCVAECCSVLQCVAVCCSVLSRANLSPLELHIREYSAPRAGHICMYLF